MRIQHNIAAMNAYRNYGNNVSAVNKNLEKLSSGYKINRAGDDAAGLAISEKMRAQITGLETAQKNAKDGISLVKTAEGALQEVHDMLNRMVTLATQSANGTYDNETDRAQLQKEVEQLKSEINRIADSANFNGIQLLNGDMDADGLRKNVETVFSGLTMSNNKFGIAAGESAVTTDTKFGSGNTKGGLILSGQYTTDTTGAVDKSDNSIRYHQDPKGAGKTSFTVDLDGINYEVDPGTALEDLEFHMATADTVGTFLGTNDLFLKSDGTGELKYSLTAGANGVTSEDIAKAIQKVIDDNDGKVYLKAGGQNIEYSVTREGDKLHFEMTNKGYDTAAANYDATDAAKNTFAGNFNFGVATGNAVTAANSAEKAFATAVSDKNLGNTSTCEINQGSPSAGTIYAQAYIRFDKTGANDTNTISDVIKDGAGIQIGDEYYLFAGSDGTFNADYADNVKVVDIRDLANLSATDGKENLDLQKALSRLSMAAKDNEMFDVQVEDRGTIIAINERTTYTGDANLTEKDWGLEKMIQKFDSASSTVDVLKEAGKSLTLQIGDTAEDFNQLKVNIKDCHTDSMGIADVNIGSQEGAAKAIDAIKAAINYVSDIRGTLGATQNRLDHTINNLSVMQENIQDAESTIRDTDIAAEMMAYTKNNILVQSAQAMLAQANQIPQGVLQLLG